MNCRICGKAQSWTPHHISYEPEVMVWVCTDCHSRIHHGDMFYLCPLRARALSKYSIPIEDTNTYIDTDNNLERITIPEEWMRYFQLARQSKFVNRKQWKRFLHNIENEL